MGLGLLRLGWFVTRGRSSHGQGMSATWREGTVLLAAVTVTAEDGAVERRVYTRLRASVVLYMETVGAHVEGGGGGGGSHWDIRGCGAHRPGTMWGPVGRPLWSRLEASGTPGFSDYKWTIQGSVSLTSIHSSLHTKTRNTHTLSL